MVQLTPIRIFLERFFFLCCQLEWNAAVGNSGAGIILFGVGIFVRGKVRLERGPSLAHSLSKRVSPAAASSLSFSLLGSGQD